jgi:hypothetical protein
MTVDAIGFQTWLSDFNCKFPGVRDWLRSIGDGDTDALLDGWERALLSVELTDALEATQRMLAGEFDGPGDRQSQWQCIPARVRHAAMEIVAERWAPGIVSQRDELEQLRNLFVLDREKAGMTREQINRELVAAGFEPIAVAEASL